MDLTTFMDLTTCVSFCCNQGQAWAAAWLESGVVTEPWAPVLDLNEVKRRY